MTHPLSAIAAFNHILLIQRAHPQPCVTVTIEPCDTPPDQPLAWWMICSFSSLHHANTFACYLRYLSHRPPRIYPSPDGSHIIHLDLSAAPPLPLTITWTIAHGQAGTDTFRQLIAALSLSPTP